MSSGLLYLAIVGVWAGVLVPMWVRRSDAGDVRGPEPADVPLPARGQGRARARVIARRRRRLSGIVALLLVTVVIAAAGLAPWWIVPVPGLALVGYLACLRAAAAYDAELAARGRARSERQARGRDGPERDAPVAADTPAASEAGTPAAEPEDAEWAAPGAGPVGATELASRDPRVIEFPTGGIRSAGTVSERDELFDQYAHPPRRAVGD